MVHQHLVLFSSLTEGQWDTGRHVVFRFCTKELIIQNVRYVITIKRGVPLTVCMMQINDGGIVFRNQVRISKYIFFYSPVPHLYTTKKNNVPFVFLIFFQEFLVIGLLHNIIVHSLESLISGLWSILQQAWNDINIPFKTHSQDLIYLSVKQP
jgi:hypothetical protein